MTSLEAQNPFAPPRAPLGDGIDTEAGMVEAGRGARFAAVVIDGLAVGIIGFVAAIALPAYASYQKRAVLASGGHPAANAKVVMMVLGGLGVAVMLAVLACTALFVYRYGQTIGKRVMGIRVVRTDGNRVAFGRFLFLRWLPITALGMIPFVGFAVSLLDSLLIFRDNRLCLHDNIAGTRVVTAATSEHATLRGAAGGQLRTFTM